MKLQNGKINVGAWWPPIHVAKIDEARKGTYLSRSAFILKNLLEHIAEIEASKRKEKDGRGVQPTKLSATETTTTSATSEGGTSKDGRHPE